MNGLSPIEPNPYQSPQGTEPLAPERGERQGVWISVFMIVVGAFFCVTSFYLILGHGVAPLVASYHIQGRFPVAFMVFYGSMGGFTSLFHLSYLLRNWPQQDLAGLYAILLGLVLTGIAVAILELGP